MKKRTYHKSQQFGDWTLISYLGGGGNGEVWKCADSDNNLFAIKLLKSVKPKPYARFLDETTVLKSNSDIEGIIPIVDSYLPDNLADSTPFYVMPVADNAEKQLKGKSIEAKINAIIEIGETLQKLHERGISHRDIKPPNFLVYNSRFSLADFGLVDYPDKQDISFKNEEIGAKWTMAPEMKRESTKADGKKADVYSLAKTLWIILTENPKGFDGQYSANSILGLRNYYKNKYTKPLDDLLSACTDNAPDNRPDIIKFLDSLSDWKLLNEDYHKRNQEQWFEIQNQLFPSSFPQRVIWEKIDDIIAVLKIACTYDNLNHMFFPDGGGLDLEDVRMANEHDCIELDFQIIYIVKPKRLIFESFDYDPEWNYFRLELNELKPSIDYEDDGDEEPYEKRYDHEGVSEIYQGQYDKYDIVENRDYYNEIGYDIPESARQVTRWFRGAFVIFNKRSVYNLTSSTYDGRHNKMNTDEFRAYIQRSVNHFKEEESKLSLIERIKYRQRMRKR